MKKLTYSQAGVNIDEGARLVSLIKPAVRSSYRKEVLGDIGGFGALFSGRFKGLKEPVLVSSTDGVGTKLMVAFMADRHDTVGIDLVAMSVNDILVSGAEPLFFLDYFATGKLDAKRAADVVTGIAKGCKLAGCALIGGETAEMPGLYKTGEYDLAGFAVGVADKKKLIDGSKIRPGDRVIGLASSGLHSNGFSLARKVIFDILKLKVKDRPKGFTTDIGSVLLAPTRIYVKPVLKLMKEHDVLGMAHITGGGFTDNIPRVLPDGVSVVIENGSWPVPPIFRLIKEGGSIETGEMLRTFNCGIGLILIVRAKDEKAVLIRLKALKEKAFTIGEVARRRGKGPQVEFTGKSGIL
ncbi:MAG TPA: phosphoribosylformylglycinamidine cyclo-ligase [Deltaproteobacteria bacterium]|nr:MAG: phosphoribosylformylglycinamidine cyclo-ligase [Deltaproteobacteria bacterium GWA2_55_82]OGQ63255.1 MAG: phosphoribosylformylglycinamidine cyclo-ligase [Deltaproteobacteria bacterium RIFCSPLOWO2_02_FULL_55_12]OIJ73090.1 MAG: phosphoribosylformylglycinamidine cyclo-ligase [Deltaproteobacteria bacterium GWC2_55_46]HBG47853.1 phosphoribosylformylglycinamidine cyclo-ligase [Deltaproteobacteria bacterium]HCY11884.1 phosphoribosylformylglycinamidine cyclo-ligase [Deltaproteobacteria bacterium